ncbi:hypothetical protein L209DRAFT_746847 [Thermothelomyces heterothallicus CBS 203.75]
MPPIDIRYVEVKYNKARGDHIANTTTELLKVLPTIGNLFDHADVRKTRRFSKQGKFIDQASPGPKIGSAYTEELAEQHPSGGLVWLYSISPETVNTMALTSRFGMLY